MENTEESAGSLISLYPLLQSMLTASCGSMREHLTKSQVMVLVTLYAYGSTGMSLLSQYIGSSREQATRAVAPLAEMGLVEREIPSTDRKQVIICLTEEGREFIEGIRQEFHDRILEHVDNSLEPEEREQLAEALRAAVPLLKKIR